MTAALWALVALPALTGLVLLLAGRRADTAAAPCAVVSAALGLGLGAVVAATRPTATAPALAGVPAGLAVDGLSAAMVLTVTAVFLAVVVYAAGELEPGEARARFFGFMSLFASAMLVTVTAADLLILLASWEVMGATSYALIGYWWSDPDRARSATLAFVTTRAGDLGLYLAAGAALAGGAGALGLAGLAGLEGAWRDAAVAGVVVAALGKSAQLPFSFWLSRAMAGPTPVSALLHSAAMVAAGGYLLVRVAPALAATAWAGAAVAWAGVATALLMGAVALAQSDLKQLLAASTASQIGFVVLAAGAGGVAAGGLQFVAHASAKSLLFLCAGAWLAAPGARGLEGLRGAARRRPLVGAVFSVGALAVAGVPPLGLWAAKDAVLAAALAASPALYAAGLAASAMSAAYAAKALAAVWVPVPERERQEGREEAREEPRHRATAVGLSAPARIPRAAERVPLVALAVTAAALGAFALPPLAHWWRALLGVPAEHVPAEGEVAVSALLAVAVVAGVGAAYARGPVLGRVPDRLRPLRAWLGDWLGLERLARGAVVRPTDALARTLASFDDRVVAAGTRAAAGAVVLLGGGLAVFDDRPVAGGVRAGAGLGLYAATAVRTVVEPAADRAVGTVAAGARSAAAWALRPQTGLLHQYYVQAVVALVALATVLVLVR